MLVEALGRRQRQEADFAVHGDLLSVLLSIQLRLDPEEQGTYQQPLLLCPPHLHLHLTLGGRAVTGVMPARLPLHDVTAKCQWRMCGKRSNLTEPSTLF